MKIIFLISLFVVHMNAETTRLVPGGRIDIDPNNPEVKEAAFFAFIQISHNINSLFAHKMGKIIKAQSQVVAGVKYYLTIEVNETDCSKGPKNLDVCEVTKTEVCDAVVLLRPWDEIHKTQLLGYSCKPSSAY